MNTLLGELKNVLLPGKVIGPIKDPKIYFTQNSKPGSDVQWYERGDVEYVMGRSSLMEFDRCPARWIKGFADEDDTRFTEWGSLIDCLFLTPGDFKDRFAVQPATYQHDAMQCPVCRGITDSMSCKKCKAQRVPIRIDKEWNSNSETCSEWEADQAGKTIVKHKVFGPACDAVKVLQEDKEVMNLLECSQRQVYATASYQDEATGIEVPLKILVDLKPLLDTPYAKCLSDLKTCTTAATRPWTRTVHDHNLHVQAALYLDVWTACTGEDRTDFLHIVQESFAPFHVEKRMLSVEYIEIGRMRYLAALSKYCACLKSGIWPGYEGSRLDWNGWGIIEPEPWMVQ